MLPLRQAIRGSELAILRFTAQTGPVAQGLQSGAHDLAFCSRGPSDIWRLYGVKPKFFDISPLAWSLARPDVSPLPPNLVWLE